MRHTLILAAAVAVLAAGCSDSAADEQIALIEDQERDIGGSDDPLSDATDSQLECVDRRGVAADLDMESLLTDAFAEGAAQRTALANIVIDCIPDLGSLPSYRADFTATANGALGAGIDVDETEGGCLLQYVLDNAADPGEALAIGNTEDSARTYAEGFEACFDDASLAVLYLEEGSGAQAYGDDPGLDVLQDACVAGNDAACDLLYSQSPQGSEYEALATDCNGRGTGTAACTPGLNFLNDGSVDPKSPGLLDLEAGCANDDMIACDALFIFAPIGSELTQFGSTCGGKIAVGAIPNCRTRFGVD